MKQGFHFPASKGKTERAGSDFWSDPARKPLSIGLIVTLFGDWRFLAQGMPLEQNRITESGHTLHESSGGNTAIDLLADPVLVLQFLGIQIGGKVGLAVEVHALIQHGEKNFVSFPGGDGF